MTNPRPPNVLFLMSDEHRADVAGYAGDAIVRTPHLDALARDAVVFANAYTPSPICIPGRQAMMAGQFPRHCGCRQYGQDLPPGHMTWARRFAQHGYQAVCCGKLHHLGPDQMQGWTRRPYGDLEIADGHVSGRVEDVFEANIPPRPPKWSDAKEVHRAGIAEGPYQRFDAMATEAAVQVLARHFVDAEYDRMTPARPLLLKLSLLQPHYPYFTDQARFEHYLPRVRPWLDEPVFDHPFLSQRQVRPGVDASPDELRRATAAYYGMIEQVDAHVGRVLAQLAHVGQDIDDWIVVYTSDHGEMLGEHGIWEKQKFFEGSARVPLFVRWPRRFAARTVHENVNLCDLFATLCELAGLSLPDTVLDSRSMVALMDGDASAWRSRWHDETVSQFGAHNLMIKRGALKYQWYGPHMPEVLFDLERDPRERSNLIDDPAYAARLPEFRRRRDELGYGVEVEAQAR